MRLTGLQSIRLAAMSVAALALAAGPGATQALFGNDAIIEQDGTDNTATVDQSGTGNTVGTEDNPLLQSGFWNEVQIRQDGTLNRVGTDEGRVLQNGLETSPEIHNSITIEQLGTGNSVEDVFQVARGVVPRGTNSLFILQDGQSNTLSRVVQDQQPGEVAQRADVIMDGERNFVSLVRQDAGTAFKAMPNTIVLDLRGNENGQLGLTGVALVPGVEDSAIVQTRSAIDPASNGNEVVLSVLADQVRFGIRQGGRLNRIGPVSVTGNANVLGIRQEGLENDLTMAAIEGIENVIGVDQYGTNSAILNLFGESDFNTVALDQIGTNDAVVAIEGDTNDVAARQDYFGGEGGRNDLTIDIMQDNNLFDIVQEGENVLSVTLDGSDTNRRGASARLTAAGLKQGRVTQAGEDNVGEVVIVGDANTLSFSQIGFANSILATVVGTENELGLLQAGSRNEAAVSQIGHQNTALIRQ